MTTASYCDKYPGCKDCPYADNLFCEGTKRLRQEARDKRVIRALEFMDKHKIKYVETKTPNIVEVDYYTQRYRFSLNHFKICINNQWMNKKKGSLLKPNTILNFGKHMGKRLNEINDSNYLNWLLCQTDIMIHPDIFKT